MLPVLFPVIASVPPPSASVLPLLIRLVGVARLVKLSVSVPPPRFKPPVKVLTLELVSDKAPVPPLPVLRDTFPPNAPLPMILLRVMPPVLNVPMFSDWVPVVAEPVMDPTVSNPVLVLERLYVETAALSVIAELMVLAPVDC